MTLLHFLYWKSGVLIDLIDDGPVEHIVIIVALLVKKVQENLLQIGIVRLVLKTQRAAIVHVV